MTILLCSHPSCISAVTHITKWGNWCNFHYSRAEVLTTCPTCHSRKFITVGKKSLYAWTAGMRAQEAFPGLSDDDRERLISGTCSECWDKLFKEPSENSSEED